VSLCVLRMREGRRRGYGSYCRKGWMKQRERGRKCCKSSLQMSTATVVSSEKLRVGCVLLAGEKGITGVTI
jgi:hypothetical protein